MSVQQKALYLAAPQGDFELRSREVTEPGPGEVLVEVHATALNPVDWKIQAWNLFNLEYPTILGHDASGIVRKVGEGVTNVSVGDNVLHEGALDNNHGTFQQYTIAPAEVVAKIPDNLTFDQAATVPATFNTAAIGLYQKRQEGGGIGLYPPWQEGGHGKYAGQPILVIGGSSSVGQYVIQLAKLSGFSPIIATASPSNEGYVKSFGATHVIDRSLPLAELSTAVKAITPKPIEVAFDAISKPETQNAAYNVLTSGGSLVIVLPNAIAKLADEKYVAQVFGNVHPAFQREFGKGLYAKLTELLASGDIKPNRVEVLPGGLAGIPEGLNKLKSGVSAVKLVVHPHETT